MSHLMASKRARPSEPDSPTHTADGGPPKRSRHGFRVGPANLPDGPWKRRNDRIKQDLIHQAKVKKAYARTKAAVAAEDGAGPAMHPDRTAMLSGGRPKDRPRRGGVGNAGDDKETSDGKDGEAPENKSEEGEASEQRRCRRPHQRPDYFQRDLNFATKRAQEASDRKAERERSVAERERMRKAMGKARAARQSNGQRKLGRESKPLLEKVKKLVGKV
jgi:hypothetical protein